MKTQLLSIAVLVALAACATAYDPGHPYERDWRLGMVEEIGSATASFPMTGFDCRPRAARAQNARDVRYAYVRFVVAGGTKYVNSIPKQRHVIVAVPDDLDVQEGEWMYVNIRDCSQRLARPSSQPG